MNCADWLSRHVDVLASVEGQPEQVFVRGAGAWEWTDEGVQYLDLMAGNGNTLLGHAHPAITEALTEQSQTLSQLNTRFTSTTQIQAAEVLLSVVCPNHVPSDSRVLFTGGQIEALEGALSIAKLVGGDNRKRILVVEGLNRGQVTWTTSPVNALGCLEDRFEKLGLEIEVLPYASLAFLQRALEGARAQNVAAVLIEPIQVKAGVRDISDAYLHLAREATARAGALMIVDETDCGMGRTGQWMAHHQSQIKPDLVILGSSIAGGLPSGAVVSLQAQTSSVLNKKLQGHSNSADPLIMAAVIANIQTIRQEKLLDNARSMGRQLRQQLLALKHPILSICRGRGFLLAIGINAPVSELIVNKLYSSGFITYAPDPFTIMLTPALVLDRQQVRLFPQALAQVLEEM